LWVDGGARPRFLNAMDYVEERSFVLRFALEARFPDDYEGERDGMAWYEDWERALKPKVLRAVLQTLTQEPGWRVHARNRGADSEREIELVVEPQI
jgi:hypothetical protein